MSSVDNRVVQMEFDNKRFESNVSTTMSTLEKLKKALHFGDETDSLERLQEVSDGFDLGHMSKALDNISSKFTLLGQVGFQAMEKIATAAVNAGTQLIKSIGVDQIGAGMSKYEQETNSVQAIYAAVKRKGKSLDDVYASLDKLAEYSDETSYSYTQMVDGASKFIANGIDMDVAVSSMMGIANAAAQSGVSIQDASYAFKNFSDAMSAGHFMIKDWQSIQNIHMDTEQFKEEVIAAAKELGKLDAQGRAIDKTTGKVGKNVQALTVENFRENLRYGFFDTEVMLKVLEKYSDFDWDRIRSGNFETFGDEAAAMAQQAKTFTDVIDSVKDAASTGWKESFRYLFGNLEEAIDFFTPMANNIIGVVQEISEARNTLLAGWSEAGGRDSMIGALKTIWDTFILIKEVAKSVGSSLWGASSPFGPLLDGNILANITKGFQNGAESFKKWLNSMDPASGGVRLTKIWGIFRGLGSVVELVRQVFSGISTFTKNIFGQLMPTFDAVLSFFSSVGMAIGRAVENIRKSGAITKIANSLANAFKPITSRLPGLIRNTQQLFQNAIKFVQTNPKIKKLTASIRIMFSTILNKLPDVVEGMIQYGKSLLEWAKTTNVWKIIADGYNKYLKPLGSKIADFGSILSNAITDFFTVDTSGEQGFWNKLKKRFSVFTRLSAWFKSNWAKFKQRFPIVQNLQDWFANAFRSVSNWFKTADLGKRISNVWDQLKNAFSTFLSFDTSGIHGTWNKIKARFETTFSGLGESLGGVWQTIKSKVEPIIQKIKDFVARIFNSDGLIDAISGTSSSNVDASAISKKKTVFDVIKDFFNGIVEWAKDVGLGRILVYAYSILRIIKIFKKIKTTFSLVHNVSKTVSSIGGTFEALTDRIKGKKPGRAQNVIKNILSIAVSMWLMVDAVNRFGNMPIDTFLIGIFRMTTLFGALAAFMIAVNKYGKLERGQSSPLSFGVLIGTIAALYSMLHLINKISRMDFGHFISGFAGVTAILGALGAFMIAVNKLGKLDVGQSSSLKFGSLIGIATSILVLSASVVLFGVLPFGRMMQGIFGVTLMLGALSGMMVVVNKFGKIGIEQQSVLKFGTLIGVAASLLVLSTIVLTFSLLPFSRMMQGILGLTLIVGALGGLFVLVNKLGSGASNSSTLKFGSLIGIAIAVTTFAGIILVLGSMPFNKMAQGILGLAAVVGALLLVTRTLSKMNNVNLSGKGLLGFAAVVGSLMAVMYVFTELLKTVKDISAGQMLAFSGSILILSLAMIPLTGIVETLGALGIGTALKGAIGLIAVFAALSAGIALLGSATGSAISGFGSAMAELGAGLAGFNDLTSGLDSGDVSNKLGIAKEMADTAVSIGSKSYGNLDAFNEAIAKLGAGMLLFNMTTGNIDMSGKKQVITDLVKMAEDLSGIAAVSDVSETVANLGAAIKLYGENVDGVKLDNVPDSTRIAEIFAAIQESATASLSDEALSAVSGYASEDSANSLTQFALGLTNITTAFSGFSSSMEGVEFGNIEQAIANLESLASLTTRLEGTTTVVSQFAGWSVTLTKETESLTGFSEDIVLLGTALKDFGSNIGDVDLDKMETAVKVLEKIGEIDNKLPKEGGLAQWITGTQSLSKFAGQISILGSNLKRFNDSITGEGFDIDKVTAGVEVIGKLIEANQKLPKSGGLKQWWEGTENIGEFGDQLTELGRGLAGFVTEYGDTAVSDNLLAAMAPLESIIEMQTKLATITNFSNMIGGFSAELPTLAANFKSMNDTLSGITNFANLGPIEGIIDFASTIDKKLAGRKSKTQLHDFMVDFQNMIKDIKWIGDYADSAYDINTDKVNDIATRLGSIFTTMSEGLGSTFAMALGDGMDNQNGTVESSAGGLGDSAVGKLNGYYQQFYDAGSYLAMGLAAGIRSGTEEVVSAIEGLADKTAEAFQLKTDEASPSKLFAKFGGFLSEGLAIGIRKSSYMATDATANVGTGMIDKFKEVLGIHSPSYEFETLGQNTIEGAKVGVKEETPNLIQQVTDAAMAMVDGAKEAMVDAGAWLTMPRDGSMTEEEYRKIYGDLYGSKIEDAVDEYLKPTSGGSKAAAAAAEGASGSGGGGKGGGKSSGSYSGSGGSGKDYSSDLATLVGEMQLANSRIENIMSDLSGYIQYQYSGGLTSLGYTLASIMENMDLSGFSGEGGISNLTPVVDGDDLSGFNGNLGNLGYDASDLTAQAETIAAGMIYTESLNAIIGELQTMNSKIDDLYEMIENTQIVLDSGELVGSTAGDYDLAIGRRTGYAGRNIAT